MCDDTKQTAKQLNLKKKKIKHHWLQCGFKIFNEYQNSIMHAHRVIPGFAVILSSVTGTFSAKKKKRERES